MSEETSPTTSPDPTSLLANLLTRREQIKDELLLPLMVPRWSDPEIRVTYRPISPTEQAKIVRKYDDKRHKNLSDPERALRVAKDALITACHEVTAIIDDVEFSFGEDPHGPKTRFDADMAKTIELEDTSARAVLDKVYIEEGDLLAAYFRVQDFSAEASADSDEEFQGE